MPLPHIKKRCTAMCRASRERCKNPAAYGMATCRYHGARKPDTVRRGEDHPQYRHGRFAQATRTQYRDDMRKLRDIERLVYQAGLGSEVQRRGRPPENNSFRGSLGSDCALRSSALSLPAEVFDMGIAEIIENAKRRRQVNPLRSGWFKLYEAHRDISLWCEEIDRVGALRSRKGSSGRDLRHCTAEDWHIWLRHLPENILDEIFWKVFPAIDALGADGVPASKIEEIKRLYIPRLEALVADIKALPGVNATRERNAIRDDSSALKRIAVTARDILAEILRQVGDYRQTHKGG